MDTSLTEKQILKGFFEIIKTLATVFIIAFLIKTYLIQTFIVDGQSMETSFHNGEYLLVDKLSYRLSDPKRGDIIVFIPPDDVSRDYIKRVIGLPGDMIKVTPTSVSVNGTIIQEPYLSVTKNSLGSSDEVYSIKLGATDYFVMGDNRTNSRDSRSIGPIKKSDIVGRSFMVMYPFANFGLVKLPSYSVFATSTQ